MNNLLSVKMKERLNELINNLIDERIVYNVADFATQVGKQRGYVSQALNGKRTITSNFIKSIAKRFPQVNPNWLMTGEGDMIISGTHIGDNIISTHASGNSTVSASVNYHTPRPRSNDSIEAKLKEKDKEIAELRRLLEEEKARSEKYWQMIEKLTNN